MTVAVYRIQAVADAMKVLRCLAWTPRPARLTEVALTVKLPKSKVFRILKTLEADGFAECIRERWFLGTELWRAVDHNLTATLEKFRKG